MDYHIDVLNIVSWPLTTSRPRCMLINGLNVNRMTNAKKSICLMIRHAEGNRIDNT